MALDGPVSSADGNCVETKSHTSCDNDVVVLGACNVDFLSYVPHLPVAGETLCATKFQNGFGGKAANQSVAAARLGSKTALIAKFGDDDWADKYEENLHKHGVSTKHVTRVEGQKTGMAQICVAENGENQIVMIPGANNTLSADDVENADELLKSAKVLVCQLETPLQTTLTALRRFKHGISILNASPAPSVASIELFSLPSILCINQLEAASMTKRPVPNLEEAKRAISNILCLGCHTVIITLGENGAIFASSKEPKPIHVRAPKVEQVVDTTGAGDAFVGALAHYFARHPDAPLLKKVGGAVHLASMTVQKYGTQTSYPLGKDLRVDINLKNFDWAFV